jgi:hypothetical protein
MRRDGQSSRRRLEVHQIRKQFFWISIGGFLLFLALYGLFPFLRKPLVRENNILEMLQVLLYGAAIWLSIRNLDHFPKGWIRKAYMLIPLVGVVGVLEEMSYGNTIFPIYKILFSKTLIIEGTKIDAVHDVFEVLYVWWGSTVIWGLVIFCGICIMMVVGILLLKLRNKRKNLFEAMQDAFRCFPPLGFFMLCGMGLVLALILDLAKEDLSFLNFMEESIETLAALALLYAALAIPYSPGKIPMTG